MDNQVNLQRKAEAIVKSEAKSNGINIVGLIGFLLSVMSIIAVAACAAILFFSRIDVSVIKNNMTTYIPSFSVIVGLLDISFILSAIGAFMGIIIEKKRKIKAKSTLSFAGMAISVTAMVIIVALCLYFVF